MIKPAPSPLQTYIDQVNASGGFDEAAVDASLALANKVLGPPSNDPIKYWSLTRIAKYDDPVYGTFRSPTARERMINRLISEQQISPAVFDRLNYAFLTAMTFDEQKAMLLTNSGFAHWSFSSDPLQVRQPLRSPEFQKTWQAFNATKQQAVVALQASGYQVQYGGAQFVGIDATPYGFAVLVTKKGISELAVYNRDQFLGMANARSL